MSDNLFKALGKVFDIGHSHFFCYFANRQGGGLQEYHGHVHFVV